MQSIALQITLVLLAAVVVCFAWVLLHARGGAPLPQVPAAAYRLRAVLFWISAVAGAAIALLTLTPWPHDARAAEVTRYIDVKGRQWAWELSGTRVAAGDVVEFRVASVDVNHGFGLYDSDMRVVAQIQAMPGFTNKVRYRFDRPGKYEILCLEFCGVAHHRMAAEIDVQAAPIH